MENTSNKNDSREALVGWTKDEKFCLLLALKSFGSYNVAKVQEYVSTKTLEETKKAIEYYQSQARQHPVFEERVEKSRHSHKPRLPLTSWAKLLSDSLNFNELRTEIPTALRLIADLEDLPPAACTDSIDFSEVYHQVANAMEGKALIPDLVTTAIINKCIVETALSSKAFIKQSAFKYVVNNVDLSDKEINIFPRPTLNPEQGVLRHLASQRSYNPLRVPEEYLQPTSDTTWDETMANYEKKKFIQKLRESNY